jgi:hypothetical protein
MPPCELHPVGYPDCLVIHLHWSEDCPAWKHCWWRLWHIHTYGQLEKRWQSRKWRKRMNKERSDPSAWTDYWREKGEGGNATNLGR